MKQRHIESFRAVKASWGNGPWNDEPDVVEWTSPQGYPCVMYRNLREGPQGRFGGSGSWCGYVGVPRGHAFYGMSYDDVSSMRLGKYGPRVHGGLTYIGDHAPQGERDGRWWFGFDCSHSGDLMPHHETMLRQFSPGMPRSPLADGVYRTAEYVRTETEALALQLALPASKPHYRTGDRWGDRGLHVLAMSVRGEEPSSATVPLTKRKRRRIRVAVNQAIRNSRTREPRSRRPGAFSLRLPNYVVPFVRGWMYSAGPYGDAVRQWAREWRHKQMAPALARDVALQKRLIEEWHADPPMEGHS